MIKSFSKGAMLAVLPILAVPAFAEPETEEKSEKTEETKEAEEELICKRIAADAASRRRTKVCRTREEWKTFNKDQRRN